MPALRHTTPRRVGVIARNPQWASEQGRTVAEPRGVETLLAITESMTEAIHAETFQTDHEEGVLFDLTIGRVRCLLVEQQETVNVSLSPREQQIAVMVAAGRTNQAIARSLEISAWTVSTHLRRIYAKLAVSSRAEMVAHLLDRAEYALLVDAAQEHRLH